MTPTRAPAPAAARRRLAAFAATSGRLAHRGRNRLAVARMALEMLRDRAEGNLTDEQRTCFLEELDLFLDDFNLEAQMTRCKPGGIEAVPARAAAAEAIDLLRRRAAGLEFSLECAPPRNSDRILADPPLLRAVLLSVLGGLVEALRDFPPAGGQPPRLLVRVVSAGSRGRLELEGNSSTVLSGDFLPGRMGLGLSLCRDALAAMGGTLSCPASRDRRGARVCLTLALAPR